MAPEPPTSKDLRSQREPLRVLHLHAGNMMGGIESILLNVAQSSHLVPELQQAFVLTFDDQFAARLRSYGARVHLLPQVRLRHLASIYQSRKALRRLLGETVFDVVVTHSPWIQLIFGDVMRDCGLPVVHWMHGPYNGHWLQKLASFQRPNFVICNSRFTRSTLDRFYVGVPSAVIYAPVIPSMQTSGREEVRSSLGITPDEVVILTASRIEPLKGHDDLLRAVSKLPRAKKWRLLIAGAPNTPEEQAYFESLQQLAAGSDRIQFIGHRSDVQELIRAADIYCQANKYPDAFGVVFVEALQGGVPVVTSAMGGAREILDSATGILVPSGDSDGLVSALSRLIENVPLRQRMGSAGPARAEALCDPARQMKMLTTTLQDVVGRTKGARPS